LRSATLCTVLNASTLSGVQRLAELCTMSKSNTRLQSLAGKSFGAKPRLASMCYPMVRSALIVRFPMLKLLSPILLVAQGCRQWMAVYGEKVWI